MLVRLSALCFASHAAGCAGSAVAFDTSAAVNLPAPSSAEPRPMAVDPRDETALPDANPLPREILSLEGAWISRSIAGEEHARIRVQDEVFIDVPSGDARCDVSGLLLRCVWGGGPDGLAVLELRDGQLVGTWGRGSSSTDGGEWLLLRDREDLRD